MKTLPGCNVCPSVENSVLAPPPALALPDASTVTDIMPDTSTWYGTLFEIGSSIKSVASTAFHSVSAIAAWRPWGFAFFLLFALFVLRPRRPRITNNYIRSGRPQFKKKSR